MENEELLRRIEQLEQENKKLKEELERLQWIIKTQD